MELALWWAREVAWMRNWGGHSQVCHPLLPARTHLLEAVEHSRWCHQLGIKHSKPGPMGAVSDSNHNGQ